MMMKNRRSGFSVLETLVASLIIAVGFGAALTVTNFVLEQTNAMETDAAEDKNVATLIDNVRSNLKIYQAIYAHSQTMEGGVLLSDTMLAQTNLPYAWSANKFGLISTLSSQELATMPGRVGFVIQPYDSSPGTYLVQMRVIEDISQARAQTKNYRFLVGER